MIDSSFTSESADSKRWQQELSRRCSPHKHFKFVIILIIWIKTTFTKLWKRRELYSFVLFWACSVVKVLWGVTFHTTPASDNFVNNRAGCWRRLLFTFEKMPVSTEKKPPRVEFLHNLTISRKECDCLMMICDVMCFLMNQIAQSYLECTLSLRKTFRKTLRKTSWITSRAIVAVWSMCACFEGH